MGKGTQKETKDDGRKRSKDDGYRKTNNRRRTIDESLKKDDGDDPINNSGIIQGTEDDEEFSIETLQAFIDLINSGLIAAAQSPDDYEDANNSVNTDEVVCDLDVVVEASSDEPDDTAGSTGASESSTDVQPSKRMVYDQETDQYLIGDIVLNDGDAAWLSFNQMTNTELCYELNTDVAHYQIEPFDVESIPEELEQSYLKGRYLAFGKDTPGCLFICKKGKFWQPCWRFDNPCTGETDWIVSVYNATACISTHRHFYASFYVEIGNLQFQTAVRFFRGIEIDWRKRFYDEVEIIKKFSPDYDPFSDPYDPKNVIDFPYGDYWGSD